MKVLNLIFIATCLLGVGAEAASNETTILTKELSPGYSIRVTTSPAGIKKLYTITPREEFVVDVDREEHAANLVSVPRGDVGEIKIPSTPSETLLRFGGLIYLFTENAQHLRFPMSAIGLESWNFTKIKDANGNIAGGIFVTKTDTGNGPHTFAWVGNLHNAITEPLAINKGNDPIRFIKGIDPKVAVAVGFPNHSYIYGVKIEEIGQGVINPQTWIPPTQAQSEESRPQVENGTAQRGESAEQLRTIVTHAKPNVSDILKRLETFREEFNKRIIGQPAVSEKLYDSLLAHYTNPALSDKPVVLTLVGTTGVGKTQTAKVVAELIFGDKKAFKNLPVGNIKHSLDNGTFFGASRGVQGQQEPGLLELGITAPEMAGGGVINLDETSGIGVGQPDGRSVKASFYHRLYDIAGEGKYTAVRNGKVFDVSNFIFTLTGNEGEKLFQGTNSDKKRMEIFHANNETAKINNLLLETGVPEAFTKRQDGAILMEPLTTEKAKIIANDAFLAPQIKLFEERYGCKIHVEPNFSERVAENFFSSADGARGLEKILQRDLSVAMGPAFLEIMRRGEAGKGAVFNISLKEKLVDGLPEVKLIIDSKIGQDQKTYERDLSHHVRKDKATGLDDGGNPVQNPQLLARLRGVRGKLNEMLIGQPEVVDSVTHALTAHYMTPTLQKKGELSGGRPLNMFLVGTTGGGKTHTGSAIAYALTGNKNNFQVISLGQKQDENQINDLFGSPAGYVNHDDPAELERAIRALPNGGVIVMDEAPNMGAASPTKKDMFFKQFYDFSEGKFTSKATGITYDMRNIVLLWTGNAGEHLLQGATSDDVRKAIWKEHRSRAGVHKILREAGVPEAFLGRQDLLIFMEPTTRASVEKIGQDKFLQSEIERFEKGYPGLKIHTAPGFMNKVVRTFFNLSEGARSLWPFVYEKGKVSALIGNLILDLAPELIENPNLEITLDLETNTSDRPFVTNVEAEPKVTLKASYKHGNKTGTKEMNLTENRFERLVLSTRKALEVAYHEAGHAVVNDPKLTNTKIDHVTILTGGNTLGYARYKKAARIGGQARENVVALIASQLAGQMAQMMAGHPMAQGWQSDLSQIRTVASKYLVETGMVPGLVPIYTSENKTHLTSNQQEILTREMGKLILEGFESAKHTLETKWNTIRAVAGALMKKGEISGDEFEKITKESEVKDGVRVRAPHKLIQATELVACKDLGSLAR